MAFAEDKSRSRVGPWDVLQFASRADTKPAMWERTLKDLIRGLRANKQDEAKFIARAIDEIRDEVKSKDMELKAAAVLKLTYVRTSIVPCAAHAEPPPARNAWLRHELGVFPCA